MKRKISRNVSTQVRWLPNQTSIFIETSEDLCLRTFDIRIKPFKPIVEFKVDTNFATTCDIWSQGNEDKFFVTGHRGFNGSGAEVKLWDLRKVLQADREPVAFSLTGFIYSGHQFTPESVRFVKPLEGGSAEQCTIISASKDATMQVIDEAGNSVSSERNTDGFACMDVLAMAPFSQADRQR